MEYLSITDIETLATRANNHFFDRDSKRFFRSRILPTVYQGVGGVFFVTSEQFVGSDGQAERMYTVRQFKQSTFIREDDGRECPKVSIDTVGEFNKLTRSQAVSLAKAEASGK